MGRAGRAERIGKVCAPKGQKLLAQGNALGLVVSDNARPVRAKALTHCTNLLVLLPFLGEQKPLKVNPRRCLGLGAFAPSGRSFVLLDVALLHFHSLPYTYNSPAPIISLKTQKPRRAAAQDSARSLSGQDGVKMRLTSQPFCR